MIRSGSATPTAVAPSAARRRPGSRSTTWWSGWSPGTADSDIAPQLRDLGIGYLWVTGAGERRGVPDRQHPGLGTASGNELGTVWQLEPPVARSVITDQGSLTPVGGAAGRVPPGSAGRVFRVGEASDPRWRAEIDRPGLAPVNAGWQQAFAIPAERRRTELVAALARRLADDRPGRGAAGGLGAGRPRRTPARGPRPDQVRAPRGHLGGAGADGASGASSSPTGEVRRWPT